MMARPHSKVHRTAGRLRVFWLLSELWQFPASKPVSPQPPVTRAVVRLNYKTVEMDKQHRRRRVIIEKVHVPMETRCQRSR
jgi:hypothetical protein